MIVPEKVPITFPGANGLEYNVTFDREEIFTFIIPPEIVDYILSILELLLSNVIWKAFEDEELDELKIKLPVDVEGKIILTVITGKLLELVSCKAIELIDKNGINPKSFSRGTFPNHLDSIRDGKFNPKNKTFHEFEDILLLPEND